MSELEAIIDVISSLNLYPDEDERINYLNGKVEQNFNIVSYMKGYSLKELKKQRIFHQTERKELRNESNLRQKEINLRQEQINLRLRNEG
jgi:hypothetical protein